MCNTRVDAIEFLNAIKDDAQVARALISLAFHDRCEEIDKLCGALGDNPARERIAALSDSLKDSAKSQPSAFTQAITDLLSDGMCRHKPSAFATDGGLWKSIVNSFNALPRLYPYVFPDYESLWKKWLIVGLAGLGSLALLGTCGVLAFSSDPKKTHPDFIRFAFLGWTILPPLWMWAEYWFLWRHDSCATRTGELDRFKYAQEVGVKVWLAMAAILGLVLYK